MILIFFRQLFGFIGSRMHHGAFLCVILGLASVSGFQNLAHQWNIIGEFENWPHEQVA